MAFAGIDVEKARGVSGNTAGTVRDVADIVNAFARQMQARSDQSQYIGTPLPRPPEWQRNNFGPGYPIEGEPVDAPRQDTGQPQPRLTEYQVAYNLQLNPTRFVPWETLKRAADSPLFRACIEVRKTELASQDWVVRVSPGAAAKMAAAQGRSKEAVANELRREYQSEIDRLTDFWDVPDRKNDRDFATWIGMAADEQLTWDALAIYPHQTYGGDTLGFWVIDGSTIKPLLDESGGRPEAPFPSYQQILYGFPRGEYSAQTFTKADGTKVIPGAIQAGQLVYKRRTPRTWTPYGLSPTEQALMDGVLYNKRFGWMVAEYTEGVMPAVYMESDGTLDWTPTQLLDYERDFNNRLTGQTAERMRANFLPPGLRAAAMQTVGERYRPDYDLHLVKLVAMHYLVTITELGFTESGGLGSTGYHEGQEDIQFRKARMPDLKWFGTLCTQLQKSYLNAPDVLEFAFLGLDAEDEAAADLIDHQRLADGRQTMNELRIKIGQPPLSFKEADMPMLQTARGVVFLEGASEQAPSGVLIEPASEPNDVGDPGQGGGTSPTQRRPIKSGGGGSPKVTKEALQEIAAYARWNTKPQSRPFQFEHLTEDQAAESGLTFDHAEFAKAGGAAPKASSGLAGSLTSNWSPYSGQP